MSIFFWQQQIDNGDGRARLAMALHKDGTLMRFSGLRPGR